jgi:NADH:ubiquinone oxidoreductase subunit F (NADH-binding)
LSGLRGRGGGGFPTGRKWAAIREAAAGGECYLAVNGAEGEPGTFKDRPLLRRNPYQVVEGAAVAAFAVGARRAFICVKSHFTQEIDALGRALEEMGAEGMTGDVPIEVVLGPDEYLFGEEKALLQVIEGDAPLPRLFPPYIHGLFATSAQMGWSARPRSDEDVPSANPTLVNNVETLANVPMIMSRGPEWHRGLGTSESPGVVVATVVGDVAAPGFAEVELGMSLRQVIDLVGGGAIDGRSIKAVFSGVANPVVTAEHLDVELSYEGLRRIGSGMGACGFIVYDDTADMVAVAREFSRFLYVESCGQCPPCKFGSGEVTAYLERIERGEGSDRDIEVIGRRLEQVTDQSRCFLAEEEQIVISSIMRAFPDEFVTHLEYAWPHERSYLIPKIVDMDDMGGVVYDERHRLKRPDWTYGDGS